MSPSFAPSSSASGHRRWLLAFVLLCASLLAGCKEELFAKLDETAANAALDVLYSEGIAATKSPVDGDQWRIEVEGKDVQRAMHVARRHGVPRERFANVGEMFKKEGLVSTPTEMRMRYLFAVSQELSNTLSRIDGVVSARVHPVMPAQDPLAEKLPPASAAIFIKHLPDADVQQMAPAIRAMVARSIEGLQAENVSLTFVAARVDHSPPPTQPGLLGDSVVAALAWMLGTGFAISLLLLGWQAWRHGAALRAATSSVLVRRTHTTS